MMLMFFDAEYNCGNDKEISQELIQYGYVIYDEEKCEIVAERENFVKPVFFPELSKYIKELTGITQRQIDSGIPFWKAMLWIMAEVGKYHIRKIYVFGDDERSIRYNVDVSDMKEGDKTGVYRMLKKFRDIKHLFPFTDSVSQANARFIYGLPQVRAHQALADARALTELYEAVVEKRAYRNGLKRYHQYEKERRVYTELRRALKDAYEYDWQKMFAAAKAEVEAGTNKKYPDCYEYFIRRENTVPYIDLHLHLDGAITVDIARKLASLQNIELPTDDNTELEKLLSVPADCASLNDFLKCFELPGSLMQTRVGIREAVLSVMENMQKQGVVYAELRFAPQLHTAKGLTQEDAVKAAIEGLRKSPVHGNLILCCMRGEGNESANEETVELAAKYLVEDGGVVALDLAGAEALFPTENYKDLFAKARVNGIPFTIHAGEADGAESIRLAIEYGAARIGHGTRCYESEEVMKLARDKGVTFEMCPTSNRQTHAIETMRDFPLLRYMDYGIKVTINTDDPAIERTTLAEEFSSVEKEFGLTGEQRKKLFENAVNASFTSPEVKASLLQLKERVDGSARE